MAALHMSLWRRVCAEQEQYWILAEASSSDVFLVVVTVKLLRGRHDKDIPLGHQIGRHRR